MNFRRLLLLAGMLGVGLVIVANLGAYGRFASVIKNVHWQVFILVGVVQLVSYYCNARYYQSFLAISGHRVPLAKLYRVALAVNFANQAIPSGGVAGATYITQALAGDVPSGKAALAQLFRYVFTFVTFIVVLIIGFVMLLFFDANLGKISVRVVMLVMAVVITTGLLLLLFLTDKSKLRAVLVPLLRTYNRVGQKLLRRRFKPVKPEPVRNFFNEFYAGIDELLVSRVKWIWPLLWAFGGNLAEVGTIYVVFLAFGHLINPGVVIVAYSFANIASLAAIFTAGVGLYEATMIGTMASLGVPVALGLAVVVVYRVINLGLFLPPGFYFYRQNLSKEAKP